MASITPLLIDKVNEKLKEMTSEMLSIFQTNSTHHITEIHQTANKYRHSVLDILQQKHHPMDTKEQTPPSIPQQQEFTVKDLDDSTSKEHTKTLAIIAKGLKFKGKQRRDFFKGLARPKDDGNVGDIVPRALYQVGVSYEEDHNYERAIKYYKHSMVKQQQSPQKVTPQTIHRLAYCVQKEKGDGSLLDKNTVTQLKDAFYFGTMDKYKSFRLKWYQQNEYKLQLIEAAACCLMLGSHHSDNDVSLCWFKNGLNILQQTQCIISHKNESTNMYNKQMSKELDAYTMNIVEELSARYQTNIVHKFQYNRSTVKRLENDDCFREYHQKKDKYKDFTAYLEDELRCYSELRVDHYLVGELNENLVDELCQIADIYKGKKRFEEAIKYINLAVKYLGDDRDETMKQNVMNKWKQIQNLKDIVSSDSDKDTEIDNSDDDVICYGDAPPKKKKVIEDYYGKENEDCDKSETTNSSQPSDDCYEAPKKPKQKQVKENHAEHKENVKQPKNMNTKQPMDIYYNLNELQCERIKKIMAKMKEAYKRHHDEVHKMEQTEIQNMVSAYLNEKIDTETAEFIRSFARDWRERIETHGIFFLESIKEMMAEKTTATISNINVRDIEHMAICNDEDHDDLYEDAETESECDRESDEEYFPTQLAPRNKRTNTAKPKRNKKKHSNTNQKKEKDSNSNENCVVDQENWSTAKKKAWRNRMENESEFYYRFNAIGICSDDAKQIKMCRETTGGKWNENEMKIMMQNALKYGVNDKWGIYSKNIPRHVGYTVSNKWRGLIKKGWVKDNNYYWDNNHVLKCKKGSKKYATYRKYAFTVIEDPSGVWKNLPQQHPKHPTQHQCDTIDKELGYSTRKRKREDEDEGDEPKRKKRKKVNKKKRKKSNDNEDVFYTDDGDDFDRAKDVNPLPDFIDTITKCTVVKPAISPYGHVLGYDTWTKILRQPNTKDQCPFTLKKLSRRDLTKLTIENIDEYRDKIINDRVD